MRPDLRFLFGAAAVIGGGGGEDDDGGSGDGGGGAFEAFDAGGMPIGGDFWTWLAGGGTGASGTSVGGMVDEDTAGPAFDNDDAEAGVTAGIGPGASGTGSPSVVLLAEPGNMTGSESVILGLTGLLSLLPLA